MKKVLAIILAAILMVTSAGHVMAATEGIEENVFSAIATSERVSGDGVYSEASYEGFDLTWENNGERDFLMSATNEKGTVYFQYDVNGYRTSKINADGEETVFVYDDGNLVFVQRGTHFLEYIYNTENKLTEVVIDNTSYACVLEGNSVYQLINDEGNLVVQYEYENERVVSVYGCNERGVLVDKTNEKTFVGNLNKVTYNSYYFDEETGWYYHGRYIDVDGHRFVDGIDVAVDEILQRFENSRLINDLFKKGYQMYSELIKNANFGYSINDTSSDWYAGLSDVELYARLIYGENPYEGVLADERCAVAWVLWNRKVKDGYGGDTLRAVATNLGAFLAIGAGKYSENARIPGTAGGAWSNAVAYACLIYCAETGGYSDPTSELEEAMPRPLGITANHTFFSNYHSSLAKLNAGKTLDSAVIAGYGSVGSSAWMLEVSYSEYIDILYEETGVDIEEGRGSAEFKGKVNVFYTNYPG